MPEKKQYIMVCAPSGTGLRSTIEKIQTTLTDVEVQDVEDILCKSFKATHALEKVGVECPSGVSMWPAMYDITWNLSRSQILELWKDAVSEALHKLANSDRNVKILSCHLVYYGGRRDEFYSPINTSCLESANIGPSHILLLIDDVYDMYLRLSGEKALFDPKDRIPSLHGRIREEEGVDVGILQLDQVASLSLIWQVRILELLLSWRQLEMVLAEKLATHLQAEFLVWGTKQLTNAAALWFQKDNSASIYLSHPISRPRRKFRETKKWDDIEVVGQFNELQGKFLENELVCIMPTAIDEYRIHRTERNGYLPLREPILEPRWPLPADTGELMYSPMDTATDVNHEKVISFKNWDFEHCEFCDFNGSASNSLCEIADAVLRCFEHTIESHISSRDHLFVSWCNGFLVFRPLFLEGRYSSGVRAEIIHWKILAKTNSKKRAAFIHFDEDVNVLLDYHKRDGQRIEVMKNEIRDNLKETVSEDANLSLRDANFALRYIERGKPSEMLDQAPIPYWRIAEIERHLLDYKRRSEEFWLFEKLSGYDMGIEDVTSDQIAVWVLKDMNDLRSNYSDIANFLKNGDKPSESSLERFQFFPG